MKQNPLLSVSSAGLSAFVALLVALAPANASAGTGGPSCVGQLASASGGPGYGQVVSSFAHDAQPFGATVSFFATYTPTSECPFG